MLRTKTTLYFEHAQQRRRSIGSCSASKRRGSEQTDSCTSISRPEHNSNGNIRNRFRLKGREVIQIDDDWKLILYVHVPLEHIHVFSYQCNAVNVGDSKKSHSKLCACLTLGIVVLDRVDMPLPGKAIHDNPASATCDRDSLTPSLRLHSPERLRLAEATDVW